MIAHRPAAVRPLRAPACRVLSACMILGCAALAAAARAEEPSPRPEPTAVRTSCTAEERREALRAEQEQVLAAAPREVESLVAALEPGGPLAGWRLSHGLVVLAGGGVVALDRIDAPPPLPPLLLDAPSEASSPEDWLDVDGEDGPYRLAGWGYFATYVPGSEPPARRCIEPHEWFVHEAGWHTTDGGMILTPGAEREPPRPTGVGVFFWHPQTWDIHFWAGEDGVPTIAFDNPRAREGGVRLPEGSFFRLVNGRKEPP